MSDELRERIKQALYAKLVLVYVPDSTHGANPTAVGVSEELASKYADDLLSIIEQHTQLAVAAALEKAAHIPKLRVPTHFDDQAQQMTPLEQALRDMLLKAERQAKKLLDVTDMWSRGYATAFDLVAESIRRILDAEQKRREQQQDNELTIDDGFGSVWSKRCPQCGQLTMQVMRPGEAQCSNCG